MSNTLRNVDFREASRAKAKACIAIEGLAGTGKSGLALLIGYVLSGKDWTKVYECDTENRSLDLFQGIDSSLGERFGKFKKFDLLPIHGYSPSNYYAVKEAAKKNGAMCFINDSATHMWVSTGGVLDLVSTEKAKDSRMDNYRVWGLPVIMQEKNLITSCLRDADVHVISTIRVKEKFEMTQEDGKSKLKSLGEQQIMMPDMKYEPDLVLSMVSPGTTLGKPPVAMVTKSRYAIFELGKEYEFTPTVLETLRQYLDEGVDPEILKQQQKDELIVMIRDTLNNPSKATVFPFILEQLKLPKNADITTLSLNVIKDIYSLLIS